MARPLPSSKLAESLSSFGSGDQSCNECKRRKNRCDKQLPQCGACARNKRHCLYERLGKTPLTRRHLTEVELRLRQTEARLKDAEHRAQLAESQLQTPRSLSVPDQHAPTPLPGEDNGLQAETTIFPEGNLESSTTRDPVQPHQAPQQCLEYCPPGSEDFSWDERHAVDQFQEERVATGEAAKSPGIADGMASLSLDDRGSGYLGVASGAAMLRILMPQPEEARDSLMPTDKPPVLEEPRTASIADAGWIATPVWHERRIWEIDLDAAIDAYFALYHLSYPIVNESTFRAEYARNIPRPGGKSWNALAYVVAAIGIITTTAEPVRDLDLFEAAKANLSVDDMETGNMTLVQALTLIANYIQKRGKPNSGYNYLGLALHMAMGLGMHKEFQHWSIPPMQMEIRRRVWWTIYCFYVGATITFGRPLAWPAHGIEVALPLNVNDEDLTTSSVNQLPPRAGLTTHSAVADQARFHLMTNEIYAKVITVPFPSAQEMLQLDEEHISTWHSIWVKPPKEIETRFMLSRSIMEWRYRNLRLIMFRPYVIRKVLQSRMGHECNESFGRANDDAVNRCLIEATLSIESIDNYWASGYRNRMASWYVIFFLFQASMIPCFCLRNEPHSYLASEWREQIKTTLGIMRSMFSINSSSREYHGVIQRLCSDYLSSTRGPPESSLGHGFEPVEESPNAQIEGLYTMMWPGADTTEIDMLTENDNWNKFLGNDAG